MRGPVTSASPRVDVLDVKQSVRAATTAALPANTRSGNRLTADANGALGAQDGVSMAVGERLLVKNEATGAHNGPYVVIDLGSGATPWILERVSDADTGAEVTAGMVVRVSEGTVNGNTAWVLVTDDPITLNTTALTFAHGPGRGVSGALAIDTALDPATWTTLVSLSLYGDVGEIARFVFMFVLGTENFTQTINQRIQVDGATAATGGDSPLTSGNGTMFGMNAVHTFTTAGTHTITFQVRDSGAGHCNPATDAMEFALASAIIAGGGA